MRTSLRQRSLWPFIAIAVAALVAVPTVVTAVGDGPVEQPASGALRQADRLNPPTRSDAPRGTGTPVLANGLAAIDSNFDVSRFLRREGGRPESSAWEPSGNFRLICEFSHFASDDPIVHPGQPGASHLHMFFGNTGADAYSTYDSLRRSGDGTCQGGPTNRSAYWAPALFDAGGQPLIPEFITVYYKGPGVTAAGGTSDVADLAPGLRMIAGALPMVPGSPSRHQWECESDGGSKGRTIPQCGADDRVGVVLPFPMCWNGTELDAADHRSHVAYTYYDDQGRERCPGSHPVPIPALTIGIWYESDGNTSSWYLSSDREGGHRHANGASFHSDWFGGWDPNVQRTWISTCINGLLNCEGGELGDGSVLSPAPEPGGT